MSEPRVAEGTDRAAGGRGRPRLPLAFLPLGLTYLAVAMNMTVASVALPTISVNLTATAGQLVWVVNITPMAAAALILFAGSWGDRFGRRRVLQAGIVVFLVAAVLSSQARSMTQLIMLRGLTGVGSALTMPAALALTFDVVVEPLRKTAVGIISATQAVGALLGPLLAGALLVHYSWGIAFLSVTPLLLLSLVLTQWRVPPGSRGEDRGPTDAGGAVLMALGASLLLFAAVSMSAGGSGSLTGVMVSGALGVLCLIALPLWERRASNPLFVGSIVRDRRFWLPTLTIAGTQFMLGSALFASTQYVQLVLGRSAFEAGFFLTPTLLVWTLCAVSVGTATRRVGDRVVLAGGLLLAAAGMLLIGTGGVHPWMPALYLGTILLGFMGVGPALTTHMAVSVYPEQRRAVGSAINSVAVRLGLAFGLAAGGLIISHAFAAGMLDHLGSLTPAQAAKADENLGAAIQVARELPAAAGAALSEAAKSAFVAGLRATVVIGATLLVVLALLNALFLPKTAGEPAPAPEVTS